MIIDPALVMLYSAAELERMGCRQIILINENGRITRPYFMEVQLLCPPLQK